MECRSRKMTIRLTPKEFEDAHEKAAIAGIGLEPFVRMLLAGCKIKPRPPDAYKDLVRELGAMGNNLNQIAHIANMSGYIQAEQTAEALAVMREVSAMVRREL